MKLLIKVYFFGVTMMKKYRDCRPHHTAPENEAGRLQLPITKHMNILEATCFMEK